jgi:hypothetical protein
MGVWWIYCLLNIGKNNQPFAFFSNAEGLLILIGMAALWITDTEEFEAGG